MTPIDGPATVGLPPSNTCLGTLCMSARPPKSSPSYSVSTTPLEYVSTVTAPCMITYHARPSSPCRNTGRQKTVFENATVSTDVPNKTYSTRADGTRVRETETGVRARARGTSNNRSGGRRNKINADRRRPGGTPARCYRVYGSLGSIPQQ